MCVSSRRIHLGLLAVLFSIASLSSAWAETYRYQNPFNRNCNCTDTGLGEPNDFGLPQVEWMFEVVELPDDEDEFEDEFEDEDEWEEEVDWIPQIEAYLWRGMLGHIHNRIALYTHGLAHNQLNDEDLNVYYDAAESRENVELELDHLRVIADYQGFSEAVEGELQDWLAAYYDTVVDPSIQSVINENPEAYGSALKNLLNRLMNDESDDEDGVDISETESLHRLVANQVLAGLYQLIANAYLSDEYPDALGRSQHLVGQFWGDHLCALEFFVMNSSERLRLLTHRQLLEAVRSGIARELGRVRNGNQDALASLRDQYEALEDRQNLSGRLARVNFGEIEVNVDTYLEGVAEAIGVPGWAALEVNDSERSHLEDEQEIIWVELSEQFEQELQDLNAHADQYTSRELYVRRLVLSFALLKIMESLDSGEEADLYGRILLSNFAKVLDAHVQVGGLMRLFQGLSYTNSAGGRIVVTEMRQPSQTRNAFM